MMMVEEDPDRVESRLAAGGYSCGSCGEGRLRPWGFARRRGDWQRRLAGVVTVRDIGP